MKWKTIKNKYHTIRTFGKSNSKIMERGKMDRLPLTHIYTIVELA